MGGGGEHWILNPDFKVPTSKFEVWNFEVWLWSLAWKKRKKKKKTKKIEKIMGGWRGERGGRITLNIEAGFEVWRGKKQKKEKEKKNEKNRQDNGWLVMAGRGRGEGHRTLKSQLWHRNSMFDPEDRTLKSQLRLRTSMFDPEDRTLKSKLRLQSSMFDPEDRTLKSKLRLQSSMLDPEDRTLKSQLRLRTSMFDPEDRTLKSQLRLRSSMFEQRTLNFEVGLRSSMFEVGTSLGSWRSGPRWVILSWTCPWSWWRSRRRTWQARNHNRNEVLRVAGYPNPVLNEIWFLTIDPFRRISVFIAKLSKRHNCWRVFEDFHSQEYIQSFDIHRCLFMRLHFSIGGYDCRRTAHFRQSIHFSITQVLFADHMHWRTGVDNKFSFPRFKSWCRQAPIFRRWEECCSVLLL